MLWDFVSSFLGFLARIITVSNPFTSAALLLRYTHLLFPLCCSLFSTQCGWSVCTSRRLSMLAHGSIEYVSKSKLVIYSLLHHLHLLFALEMWRKGQFDIKTIEWDFGEFCWYPGFSHLVGWLKQESESLAVALSQGSSESPWTFKHSSQLDIGSLQDILRM